MNKRFSLFYQAAATTSYLVCLTLTHHSFRATAFPFQSSQILRCVRSIPTKSLPSPRVPQNRQFISTSLASSLRQIRKMSSFDMNEVKASIEDTSSTSTPIASSSGPYPYPNLGYVDVHAHLLHEKFAGKEHEVVQGCITAGLDHVIINGIEPESNRQILEFCEKHYPIHMLPAMGIYPLDAACNFIFSQEDVDRIKQEREASGSTEPLPVVNWKHDFPPPTRFDVDAEIDFIEEMVKAKRIVALGECGLDKHYLTDDVSFNEQIRVLRKLMKISTKYDIPIILHTRKAEKKVFDMLIEENVKKADFHCFCGKVCMLVGILSLLCS